MITHVIAETAMETARGRTRTGYAEDFITRFWVWSYRAYVRARSRRELRALPDELLHDMGLTTADVEREASKPFWR
ncbi:DUF1127 domain-containing protein [Starkeya sp. ORNL1]|uniref:DUF1127 domain-containing protein n=1 Tax=Starkeya sp. ORNL1 TaxID=2709380 RepID=UPI001FEFF483|nr:DUF1127 domain-containing protein [Starkeya sp. ORNL1]